MFHFSDRICLSSFHAVWLLQEIIRFNYAAFALLATLSRIFLSFASKCAICVCIFVKVLNRIQSHPHVKRSYTIIEPVSSCFVLFRGLVPHRTIGRFQLVSLKYSYYFIEKEALFV